MMTKTALIDCSCYSWLYSRTNQIFFSPQCVIRAEINDSVNLPKQRLVEMETVSNPSTQGSHLISLPGYTAEKKKLISFFTLSKSARPIRLCRREIGSLPHSHGTTRHRCMRGHRLHPEARRLSHRPTPPPTSSQPPFPSPARVTQ